MHPRWAKPRWLLFGMIVLAAAGHVACMLWLPAPRFWGDEPFYLELATAEAEEPGWSLLPGTFGFDHRPLLNVRLLSLFAPHVYPATAVLNVAFLVLLVVCTYAIGRQLGLSTLASLAAAGFLAFFPWIGFHVHSLWPEVLHMSLLAGVLLLFLRFFETARLGMLIGAGVLTGYALFTKGALQPFLALFFLFLLWRFVRLPGGFVAHLTKGLLAALAFGLPLLAVVLPQLVVNERAGHGLRLAANRWWNLEAGLTTTAEHKLREIDLAYWAASSDFGERERLARERTLAFLSDTSPLRWIPDQLAKTWKLLVHKRSGFERSLFDFQRWGDTPPPLLAAMVTPARAAWFCLWVLGLPGVLLLSRRHLGWTFLAFLLCAYLVALAAVPVKIRFALPAVPLLALFAAGTCDGAWKYASRRVRRNGVAKPAGRPSAAAVEGATDP